MLDSEKKMSRMLNPLKDSKSLNLNIYLLLEISGLLEYRSRSINRYTVRLKRKTRLKINKDNYISV